MRNSVKSGICHILIFPCQDFDPNVLNVIVVAVVVVVTIVAVERNQVSWVTKKINFIFVKESDDKKRPS